MRPVKVVFGHETRRHLCSLSVLVFGLLILGCAGRASVSGRVIYKGKPLVCGTVLIEGGDGGPRQGIIEDDGSYVVEDLASGEGRVAVNSPNPSKIMLLSKGDKAPVPRPPVPGWVAIPEKFGKVDTSGLRYTLKSGSNPIDIELK